MAGVKRNRDIVVDALKTLASGAVAGTAAAAKAAGASALGVDPISAGVTVVLSAIIGQMPRSVSKEELGREIETIRTRYTRRTVGNLLDALRKYSKEAGIEEAKTPLEELVKALE